MGHLPVQVGEVALYLNNVLIRTTLGHEMSMRLDPFGRVDDRHRFAIKQVLATTRVRMSCLYVSEQFNPFS